MLPEPILSAEAKKTDLTTRVKELFREERKRREIDTITEFSEYYCQNLLASQKESRKTTILYPGSGSDLKQMYLGLYLLHNSPIEEAALVYTEISEPDPEAAEKDGGVSWYDSLTLLKGELEEELRRFVAFGLLGRMKVTAKSNTKKISGGRELPSEMIDYSFEIKTGGGTKRLTLTLDYNGSDDRPELSEVEKKFFSREFLDKLDREKDIYWPFPHKKRSGVIYPSYARTEQFRDADIILSHQCGNFNLLQLDYLRAILLGQRKQRAILTEHPESNYALMQSPPGYKTSMHKLKNNVYGYANSDSNDSVGVIMFKPTDKE